MSWLVQSLKDRSWIKVPCHLVKQYGHEHINEALEVAREYIDRQRAQGKKVGSVAGIARKAIEEGCVWRLQKTVIEIEHEEQLKAIAEAKEAELRHKEEEAARAEQIKQIAMSKYEVMSRGCYHRRETDPSNRFFLTHPVLTKKVVPS